MYLVKSPGRLEVHPSCQIAVFPPLPPLSVDILKGICIAIFFLSRTIAFIIYKYLQIAKYCLSKC